MTHERRWVVLFEWGDHATVGRHCHPDEKVLRRMAAELRVQGAGGWLALLEGDYHGDDYGDRALSLTMVRELAPSRKGWSDVEASFASRRERRRALCHGAEAPDDDDALVGRVYSLAQEGDFRRLGEILSTRTDVNDVRSGGTPILEEVLLALCPEDPWRFDVVGLLLNRGLNADALDEEGMSCLGTPLARSDYDMVCFLLDRGVNPNRGIAYDENMTIYDWAEADYRLDTGMLSHPDRPAYDGDEDAFLEGMDRWAIRFGWPRPAHLIRMRANGALTTREMASLLGFPEGRITWIDGWQVTSRDRFSSGGAK